MTDPEQYFEYLQGRSWSGLIYRNFWLYPRLNLQLRGSVLDVGCGIGDMLRYRRNNIVGADINPATVRWCREQGLDVRQMKPDMLPFDNGSFDSVILDNVLEHLDAPRPLLEETRRVLRPAGRLIIGVPGIKGYAADPDHKLFYDREGLVRCVEQMGFRTRTMFNTPLRSDWMNRNLAFYCLYGVFERD